MHPSTNGRTVDAPAEYQPSSSSKGLPKPGEPTPPVATMAAPTSGGSVSASPAASSSSYSSDARVSGGSPATECYRTTDDYARDFAIFETVVQRRQAALKVEGVEQVHD